MASGVSTVHLDFLLFVSRLPAKMRCSWFSRQSVGGTIMTKKIAKVTGSTGSLLLATQRTLAATRRAHKISDHSVCTKKKSGKANGERNSERKREIGKAKQVRSRWVAVVVVLVQIVIRGTKRHTRVHIQAYTKRKREKERGSTRNTKSSTKGQHRRTQVDSPLSSRPLRLHSP